MNKLNKKNNDIVGLWRNEPTCFFIPPNRNKRLLSYVFPSARQAISRSLRNEGLSRPDRVAVPEWSSQCVINSVAEAATPIPLKEVLENELEVKAVLLYEQWGWPFIPEAERQISKKFKNSIIIIDRVDSADINNKKRMKFYPEARQIDIISLSKILGLPGGGLAKANGKFIYFNPGSGHKALSDLLYNKIKKISEVTHIHKTYINFLPEKLGNWLAKNDIQAAFRCESRQRKNNIAFIANSRLSKAWPTWMFDALKRGAAPGIAPLFKGMARQKLEKVKDVIMEKYNIETAIYHFNYSGNPIETKYELCLAFPTHGLVKNIGFIIEDINKSIQL